MLTIHCLAYSRAIRLIWLMEDLGQPYTVVTYDRTASFRAPESLAKVHPLGKSPVIEDGDTMIAESATCLRYITDRYGDTHHHPSPGSAEAVHHEELLDYVESSFAEVAMGLLLPALKGEEATDEANRAMAQHLDYLTQKLPEQGLLFGDTATLADIQFSYILANLAAIGALEDAPRVARYWADLQQQPGYQAAVAKVGPMAPSF
ncbi:glutathione S-transferase family protein [Phaeobacter piscinae]|uniref:Glutathione S-transferase domain-containing protein n=1 Tax=Phaeobacter piscinae TaxID=1580596 RepID=A0ABM6PAU8_9RHOB|nr:glutathione S-transferase [Phaeobacter piscinae]ATG34829.1 glutathione S-transferase domain-containing protein [Phaeobacter piscinae]ATG38792.1 glutathione S-transferase domain-containing protein [Phaeobacter piscinae]AUQ85349.1 glutathione S-transferase domain-containing protein [Phaeobacter piscinae]AUR23233.1 glutathione S-transferase domain-containing protein [Phaeobacter piscinae]